MEVFTTFSPLKLQVRNVQILEAGLSAQFLWSEEGGTIGSAQLASWQLRDSLGKVKPLHCEVVLVDGAFCIKDSCGLTYINGSHMPLGKEKLVRLEHKDEIQVGPYQLRALLDNGKEEELTSGSLGMLLNIEDSDLLADGDLPEFKACDDESVVVTDPLLIFEQLMGDTDDSDLLLADEQPYDEELAQLIPDDNPALSELRFTPQADSEYEITSSVSLKKILGFEQPERKASAAIGSSMLEPAKISSELPHRTNNVQGLQMNENVLDLLEEEVAKSFHQEPQQAGVNHLLTGPMLKGLGVGIGNSHDMQHMHMLSQELGESLQAGIKGLLALHLQVQEGRFGMLNRNLQPIEDNPLRLGLSYEDTVRTLYDTEKSQVHLAAPAAIAESLKNVRDHNNAMQHAIGEALRQVLQAFSPQVLLRRFQHYKRKTDLQLSDEAWAWNMYGSYYQELTSNRQRGFEKLFWEVFEQSYDRKLREMQLES